jgi:putative methyltransferase (TIGR04325 family)
VTALLHEAVISGGRLNVIDFGGSLGSAYWQSRPFLSAVPRVDWRVVEQPHYVSLGRREFANEHLTFHSSIADASADLDQGLALLCCVLQFLPDPREILRQISRSTVTHLLIDRTPMSQSDGIRLAIQHTPKLIYPASYPQWIFPVDELLSWLAPTWRLIAEIDCPEGRRRTESGFEFEFRGLYLERVAR